MPGDDSTDARLDALLRALPQRQIAPLADARVLRTARAVLAEDRRGGVVQGLVRMWERAVAPLLVTSTVATYLVWAVHAASSLYR
jgi:hypothetical protein